MPRLFVAGATGYTGQAVVREARQRGLEVVAHIRPDSKRLADLGPVLEGLGATIDTTPWDEAALAARLAELAPTHVFALLGITQSRRRAAQRSGEAEQSYASVDEGLTRMLLRAAGSCTPPPRFVYLSSEGAGGSPRSPYMRARANCERALEASSVPWTAARPCFITGDDRDESRPLERGAAAVLDAGLSVLGLVGLGATRDAYRSISGPRLAHALVSLALDPEAACRVAGAAELQQRAGA